MAGGPTIIVVAVDERPSSTDEGAGWVNKLLPPIASTSLPWVIASPPSKAQALRKEVKGAGEVICATAGLNRGALGSCIAAAVLARPQSPGWLVLPSSMPKLQLSTLSRLAQLLSSFSLVFPQYKGLKGYPVGFGAEFFSELIALQIPEQGAQRLLARYPGHAIDVDDPEVLSHEWNDPMGVSMLPHRLFEGLDAYQRQ